MTTPADTIPSPEFLAEYNGGSLMAVSIAFIPIVTIFVALRCYARYLSKAAFGLDDYLALVSWILSVVTSILAICFVRYGGVGRHFIFWQITNPGILETYLKYLFTVGTYYYLPVSFAKLCILAFFYRIFVMKTYRWAILALAGFVVILAVVSIIVSFNLCRPLQYFWDRTIPGGNCYNEQAFYKWSSFPNIITDIIMLILPLHVVWKLQASLSIKLGLTGAFATGVIGLIGSIIKFISFSRFSAVVDGTWQSTNLMIWGSVGIYCYVIAACLVTFRPIIYHLFHVEKPQTTAFSQARSSQPSFVRSQHRNHSQTGHFSITSSDTYRSDDEEIRSARGLERPKALVIVEGGGAEELEQPYVLPGRIYVSRVWDVASSRTERQI